MYLKNVQMKLQLLNIMFVFPIKIFLAELISYCPKICIKKKDLEN